MSNDSIVEDFLENARTDGGERRLIEDILELANTYSLSIYDGGNGYQLWLELPHTQYCIMSGLGVMEEANRTSLAEHYGEGRVMEHKHALYVDIIPHHIGLDLSEEYQGDWVGHLDDVYENVKMLTEDYPVFEDEAYFNVGESRALEYLRDHLTYKGVSMDAAEFATRMQNESHYDWWDFDGPDVHVHEGIVNEFIGGLAKEVASA